MGTSGRDGSGTWWARAGRMSSPVIALSLAPCLLLAGCSSFGPGFGFGSATVGAEETKATERVQEYLVAIELGDPVAVAKFAPPGYVDVAGEVDARLSSHGGARAAGAKISVTQDVAEDVVTARISTTTADGRATQWTENFIWDAGTWWLLIGHAPPTGRRTTSSTRVSPTP
jgi:hypothetical protein